ncbi:hypothetical protein ASPFODRAFT_713851 [Aspergillus luchuensis CBS 106.47]|uniref:Uncharacterized protein n=1 Tax=Aspergillus luchuensis (strain CBS 106.47) TaxID=1137211 RepID=A0A1M3TPV1_ASPLC|nr:hypothetical protein ASPFODRAFT_713851 [Aspergillus luchuensis CBS 106.47]
MRISWPSRSVGLYWLVGSSNTAITTSLFLTWTFSTRAASLDIHALQSFKLSSLGPLPNSTRYHPTMGQPPYRLLRLEYHTIYNRTPIQGNFSRHLANFLYCLDVYAPPKRKKISKSNTTIPIFTTVMMIPLIPPQLSIAPSSLYTTFLHFLDIITLRARANPELQSPQTRVHALYIINQFIRSD